MRSKGWFVASLCAAAFAVAGQAFATSPVDFIGNAKAAEDPANQFAVAETIAHNSGLDVNRVNEIVNASTSGQYLPALAEASGIVGAGDRKTRNMMTLLNGGVSPYTRANGSGVAAAVAHDLIMTEGHFTSVAGNQAAQLALTDFIRQVDGRNQKILSVRRDLTARYGSDAGYASYLMNCDFANRIWASPFYAKHKGDQNGISESYDYKLHGVSLGYDHAFGAVTAGLAFTYSKGDYDVKGVSDDNDIKNYGVSGYVQYYNACNGFFGTLSGGYMYSDNEWKRNSMLFGGRNSADNHTNSWYIGGNVGKDFVFGSECNSFTLTPTIGLYYSHSKSAAHTWVSDNYYDVRVGSSKMKSLWMPIDLAARYTFNFANDSDLSIKATGGYAYNFKKDGSSGHSAFAVGGRSWSNKGGEQGRHNWNIGGGIEYRVRNFDIGVDYRYDKSKHVKSHNVQATVGVSF